MSAHRARSRYLPSARSGTTGLVSALALTLGGIDVRLVEKRPQAAGTSRALGLQARSMEVMAGLGLADRIEAVAYRLRGARMMRGNRTLVNMGWIPPNSPYPHTYVIPQSGLEDLLLTRLAEFGIAPERGVEITGISMDDSSVTAQTDHGEDLTSEWLIGADGAWSRVRSCIGIGFSQRVTGETYWLADAHIELPVDIGDSALWLDRNGPFMLMRLPGPDHLWRIFADVSDLGIDTDSPSRDSLSALMDARGPVGAHIHSVEWTSVFRTRIGLAERYRAGRAFLAGDAAHTFPPFGGQGMNLGIQDAMNLAWRLAGRIRGAPAEILEGYETERRPVAAATIRDVDARRRLYSLRNPIARAGRDLFLRAGRVLAAAERRTSLQNSQLTTTYRAVADGGDRGPVPRPGDRAPDVAFQDTTLHSLLGAGHFTVLELDPDAVSSTVTDRYGVRTVRAAAVDHDALGAAYGIQPGHHGSVLIRPDGHIGGRGPLSQRLHTLADRLVGNGS